MARAHAFASFPGLAMFEPTKHQAGRPWRAEWREVGAASRFWVIRGFRECGPVDVAGDFTRATDAAEAARLMNL